MKVIYQNSYGKVLPVVVINKSTGKAMDISDYTTKKLWISLPDKTLREVAATFATDGTDGVLHYTLTAADVAQVGWHRVEVHLTATGKEENTSITGYKVERKLI